MFGILRVIDLGCLVEPARDLCCQFVFGLHHAFVAHPLMLGLVGAQIGTIHRDVAEADQASLLAQCQHLNEQVAQRREVTAAELADGAEVRPVQCRDRLEVQPLLTGPRDPARGVDTLAVGGEQQRHHHARVIRWKAARLGIRREDDGEIQLLAYDVAHQMRRVPCRHKVLNRWWQQPNLVNTPRSKALRHENSESTRDRFVEQFHRYRDTLLARLVRGYGVRSRWMRGGGDEAVRRKYELKQLD